MNVVDELIAANQRYAAEAPDLPSRATPSRNLAVLTCMDARIDPPSVLGLDLGAAHVLRNAGGRVTDDVLRSLALSVHVLDVRTVVVMHHTGCGLAGTSDEELRARTGADLPFLTIDDHAGALRVDTERLRDADFLVPLRTVAGLLFDVGTGRVSELTRWTRPA
jgi:carbonic anhydrase